MISIIKNNRNIDAIAALPRTTAATDKPVRLLLTPMTEQTNPITDRTIILIRTAKELVGFVNSTTRNPHTAQEAANDRILHFFVMTSSMGIDSISFIISTVANAKQTRGGPQKKNRPFDGR
jgi:hypothetical protein